MDLAAKEVDVLDAQGRGLPEAQAGKEAQGPTKARNRGSAA